LPGRIAHAAIFTNALSTGQLLALFNASTNLLPVPLTIAPASAGKNLILTWPKGSLLQSTNLAGPWTTNTAASPCTVAPANSEMFFRVRVN
jgi:hypothetical protein